MVYTIPRERYNEAIKNLGIEENYYKRVQIKRSGKGQALNKNDIEEPKGWHKSKFRHVLYGLFLEAPQPFPVHKARKLIITARKVRVRLGLFNWQVFDVR